MQGTSKQGTSKTGSSAGPSGGPLAALAPWVNEIHAGPVHAGRVIKSRRNRDYDMHFILSGQATVRVSGRTYPMRKDDVFLYPPGVEMQESISRDGPQNLVVVHFDARPLGRKRPHLSFQGPRSPPIGLEIPIRTPGPAPARIAACFEMLLNCRQLTDAQHRILRSRALLLEIFDYLYRRTLLGKTGGGVLRKGELSTALDGDLVVVVNPTEVTELEVSSDRRGFVADAFHDIAVRTDRIHVVLEQIEGRAIVTSGVPFRGHRHANAVTNALTQRPRRRLDARGVAKLGMAGAGAVKLPELPNLI